jgi:two-component system, cell cycle response regulator
MVYVQALRVAFVCIVLGSTLFAPGLVGAHIADFSLVSAVYLACSGAVEVLRRLEGRRGLAFVQWMLLLDGVFLAWIMIGTGGPLSPLRFLTYLHLIAVTLITSYRTGLKIALWHSLLFFAVFYAQQAGYIHVDGAATESIAANPLERIATFNVLAFWLVALATATFSWLNERELRKRKEDFENLAGMGATLENVAEASEVAHTLLQYLAKTFGFERGLVLAAHEGDPVLIARLGKGEDGPLPGGRDPLVDEVWSDRKTKLIAKPDLDLNPRLGRLLPFARNVLIVPLFAESLPLGVLVLEHPRRLARIERRVVGMVGQFAAHAALSMRNAWLLEQMQHMAEVDALTSVANRRTFETTLAHEVSRSKRNGEPLTLVMIDVDHFKNFNDTHGHRAGDEALKAVAAALQSESRDFDTVARYGGEEFGVILPACSSKESLIAAERLRLAVSQIDSLAAPVTASAGVATYPTHAADTEALIKTSDEALYESKRAGRNRVTRSRRRGPRKQTHVPEPLR